MITESQARSLLFFTLFIKLCLLGLPELLPQEAYYWNYAQHLAPGYLDHPPLSAWIIAAGEALLGHNEFALRIGAFLFSLITIAASFALTTAMAGRRYAWHAAVLVATLPYFFGASFFISPDAGLTAMWSVALALIYRITVRSNEKTSLWIEWIAIGLVFGIGLLSKYTIGLVGVSAAILFLIRPELRKWFLKPQPYIALIIALLCFSPVLWWNATHEWASFVFQGARRFSGETKFSLFEYLGFVMIITTPLGIFSAIWYWTQKQDRSLARQFALLFGFLPIIFFMFYSMRHETKFIWSGPAFLAFMPFFARQMGGGFSAGWGAKLGRWWPTTAIICFIGFSGYALYDGVGFPGIGYRASMNKTIGWQDLGAEVVRQAITVKNETGKTPLIVGMDKHYTAAGVSFYVVNPANDAGLGKIEVTGRSIFGLDGLMWEFWRPSADSLPGRDAVLVARSESDLKFPQVENGFTKLSEIIPYRATRNGKLAGQYYLRIGYGMKMSS